VRFSGRTVLVTGGSSGIGLATARAFVEEGASVMITGIDRERGEATAGELGEQAAHVLMDVRSPEAVAAAFQALDRWRGGLDILVSNAGVGAGGGVDEVTVELWDDCFDTNVRGAFLSGREAIPRMRARGGGVIVATASNAGLVARAADPVYCASKAALIMLTRAMALAHAADRIRVNAVAPGPVADTLIMESNLARADDPVAEVTSTINASPMARALGRMITPREIAEAVLYLASDAAAMVTGAVLAVDGGKSAGIPR